MTKIIEEEDRTPEELALASHTPIVRSDPVGNAFAASQLIYTIVWSVVILVILIVFLIILHTYVGLF